MAVPDPIPSDVFADGEQVNAAKLYQRIYSKVNDLIGAVSAVTGVFCQAHQTVLQTLNSGSYYQLVNMVAEYGASYFNNNTVVIPAGGAGVYEIGGQATITANATRIAAVLWVNGVTRYGADAYGQGVTTVPLAPVRTALNVGDNINMALYHNASAASGTYVTAGQESRFYVKQVG